MRSYWDVDEYRDIDGGAALDFVMTGTAMLGGPA
jgi:hypothetical protein